MVLFKDPRETIEIDLPSFEGGKVIAYKSLRTGEQNELIAKYEGSGEYKGQAADIMFGQEMIFLAIKEWNFTNEDGTPFPLTYENFKLLPRKDVEHIMKALGKTPWVSDEEKKKTSDDEVDGSETAGGGQISKDWHPDESEGTERV